MAKKGVSKKTGLVNPLIKEGSKKSKEVTKALGIEKELSPASKVEEISSEYKPTPEDYKYTPKKKSKKKERLAPEQKAAIKKRRTESEEKRTARLAAESSPVKTERTNIGPLSGQPVRTPDPKAPGQRLTAVTGETIRPATNTELRKGIPSKVVRDQTKPSTPAAGPRLPRIGQIYKHSDGRMMRVGPDNIAEVHADAKRTVLPEAGREVMTPVGRPLPLPGPRGGLRPNIPRNNRGNRAGLGAAHAVVKEHADRALGHLDAMAASEHGGGSYRQAQRSFQSVHKAIGDKNMSSSIHNMLQLAHNHIDSKLPGTENMLAATKEAVGDTLKAGKRAEEERTFRQIQTDRGGN